MSHPTREASYHGPLSLCGSSFTYTPHAPSHVCTSVPAFIHEDPWPGSLLAPGAPYHTLLLVPRASPHPVPCVQLTPPRTSIAPVPPKGNSSLDAVVATEMFHAAKQLVAKFQEITGHITIEVPPSPPSYPPPLPLLLLHSILQKPPILQLPLHPCKHSNTSLLYRNSSR